MDGIIQVCAHLPVNRLAVKLDCFGPQFDTGAFLFPDFLDQILIIDIRPDT
jgi:hypothetical protein